MPAQYFRSLTGKHRSTSANRQLGFSLAFVAGATNAGGFLAVRQYTSHMSGIVSAIADQAALGDLRLVLAGIGSLASFLVGAGCSAVLVNWGRRRSLQSQYVLPLVVEAALLLLFGLLGSHLALGEAFFVPLTVILLCFIMGLQNAMITKLSGADGAIGFKHVGYVSTVPLAGALVTLAIVPVVDDLLTCLCRFERRH
ncbi:YoaK family protein [Paraburkholderia sp. BR10923]|uniref:YoaK family protein n=1 Tax=Paraburkholderia sp. BR10923 TaxID=3236992 RepID=UPI0034CF343F